MRSARPVLTGDDLAHGLGQFRRGAVLGHIAVGAGLERTHRVLLLRMHAQDQDAHAREIEPGTTQEFEPAHAGHRQVDDHHVVGPLAQALQRLEAVPGLVHVPAQLARIEHAAQAFAYDGVVVDDQDPEFRRCRRCREGTDHAADPPACACARPPAA